MISSPDKLILRYPDDWHVHLRDDAILKTVLPYTSRVNARAIIMPNLLPPVTCARQAEAYRQRILAALPPGDPFVPLMTCYLTDTTDADDIETGFRQGIFFAAKLYPAHATTHSSFGVTSLAAIAPVLERMQAVDMPLLIHGEVTDQQVDIFDREARFIDTVLDPLRRQFPLLRVVLEHVTTREAAMYVRAGDARLAATITPQHLLFNRNAMLVGGIRPHLYCLPVLKRDIHRQTLRDIVASGHPRFFAGSDSAPHLRQQKESACGCAGVFNAPVALAAYATVFEEIGALAQLAGFCAEHGANFYRLPLNSRTLTLIKAPWQVAETVQVGEEEIVPFLAGQTMHWQVSTA